MTARPDTARERRSADAAYRRGKIEGYGDGLVDGWDAAIAQVKAVVLAEPAVVTRWRDRAAAALAARRRKFQRGRGCE